MKHDEIVSNGIIAKTFINSDVKGDKAAVGTTAERPSVPLQGTYRFNTDSGSMEWYNGSTWDSPAGGTSIKFQSSFNVANTTTGGSLSGTAQVVKFIPEGDLAVSSMKCFITSAAAGTVYMGIYSGDGTTLLCEASGSTASGGIVSFATDVTANLTGGTEYWVGILEGSGSPNFGKKAVFSNSDTSMSKFVSATPTGMPTDLTGFTASPDGYFIGACA